MYINVCITKDCWEPAYDEIDAAFHNGSYRKMRGIPVYKIRGRNGDVYYVAGEPKGKDQVTVYGWVNIRKKPHWKCWTVDQSYVFPQVRSDGWGRLLYDTIITREGIILASGTEQSTTGRRMWKSMVKKDRYTIWAHDFSDPENFAPVIYDEDNDEIWSTLKIYEKWHVSHYAWQPRPDIRLIAIKKA